MALDNLEELNIPTKTSLSAFQKTALFLEIALFILGLIGIFFKIQSFPYAAEMIIISFTGLSSVYVFLPIFVFRSKKIGGHLLSHITGFFLFFALMGALFRIESWPYGGEMQIIAAFVVPPMLVLLILLSVINFKDKDKINIYLRIGLRYLIAIILLKF